MNEPKLEPGADDARQEYETRSPDGDGHEKGTVVGMEPSAPEKPTAWMNGGTGLEGRLGKPVAAERGMTAL